jgi:hypothetical protein|tara:strand:- start:4119 stop:4958 length:840 start_codon:yes stop_codon:yes gene_type:complete
MSTTETTVKAEDTLYRNKYRDGLYDKDPSEDDLETDEDLEEKDENFSTTPEQVEDTTDWKKRYGDLKSYHDKKINEIKAEQEQFKAEVSAAARQAPPKTDEELEEFRAEYPDVMEIVETVADKKAAERAATLELEVSELRDKNKGQEAQTAYQELLNKHEDFDELREDENFLGWLNAQPDEISDAIFKNNSNVKWASRVIDMYKAEVGIKKSKKPKRTARERNRDAGTSVGSKRSTPLKTSDGKRIWKLSEIRTLKGAEFEKYESDIDAAVEEGRIVDD